MLTLISILLLLVGAQEAPKTDAYRMTTYQLVVVTKSSMWQDSMVVNAAANRKGHQAYVTGLVKSGRAWIGGPFAENPAIQSVYIVSGTPDEARALAAADPTHGWWNVEVLQWMGPEGWFHKPAEGPSETIYFGFLVTGANTDAMAPEEQKRLMDGHLGHMNGQAKLGKLVLGGPLVKAGTRRGVIAYRVPTMAEALERASADPMVKAGRMKPELYEWSIPAGILK